MRIWALGDIHSNAGALRAALRLVDQRPGDELVILGDLLTYGAEPAEVVDLVSERVERGATLVLGNHDELYLELLQGDDLGLDRMPPWIVASALWTVGKIQDSGFKDLPFQAEHILQGVLFAHANPWFDRSQHGLRWAYLNSDADHRRAADVLRERDLHVGVFGHTHRSRIVEFPSGDGLGDDQRETGEWRRAHERSVLLLNAGSVGQPRNARSVSTILELEGEPGRWHVRVHPLTYDVSAHLDRLHQVPMPLEYRQRLARFFAPHLRTNSVHANHVPA